MKTKNSIFYRYHNESQGSREWTELIVLGKAVTNMEHAIAIVRAQYVMRKDPYDYIELMQETDTGISEWDNL